MIYFLCTDPVRRADNTRIFLGRGSFELFEFGQRRLGTHVQQSFAVQAEDVDAIAEVRIQICLEFSDQGFVRLIAPSGPRIGLNHGAKLLNFWFRHCFVPDSN